jgi:hypothetical protein
VPEWIGDHLYHRRFVAGQDLEPVSDKSPKVGPGESARMMRVRPRIYRFEHPVRELKVPSKNRLLRCEHSVSGELAPEQTLTLLDEFPLVEGVAGVVLGPRCLLATLLSDSAEHRTVP